MSYEVVTEIWSDDILQVGRIFADSSEDESTKSDDDAQCFTDEFVARVNSKEHLKLSIENHHKSTRELVGLQVWRAGLYLADYILGNVSSFKDRTILELAAGTGLLSLVLASKHVGCKHVICTDMDKGDILPQIRRNVKLNRDSISPTKVTVTELDFFKGVPKDDKDIRETDIIVVGDVIYDQVVTSAFFKCLESIVKLVFSSGKKFHCDAYVAMEARSRGIEELDTLAIMTNELNAFQAKAKTPGIMCDRFSLEKVKKGSFEQRFAYNSSSADMHMWKISFSKTRAAKA